MTSVKSLLMLRRRCLLSRGAEDRPVWTNGLPDGGADCPRCCLVLAREGILRPAGRLLRRGDPPPHATPHLPRSITHLPRRVSRNGMCNIGLLLSLALLLLSAAAWADDAPRYAVVPLQNLPGVETAYCNPTTLNNNGEAVGMVGAQAVRWDAQGLPHRLAPALALRDVEAINDAGEALGYTSVDNALDARLFLIDRDGRVHPLDKAHGLVLPVGAQPMGFIGGLALNDAGRVAFNTQSKFGVPRRGCLYDHGALTVMGHLPLLNYQTAFCQVTVHALNGVGMAAGGQRGPRPAERSRRLPRLPVAKRHDD